ARSAGVLIRRNQRDAGIGPDLFFESLFALLGREDAFLIAQQQHFAFAAQQSAHLLGRELAAVMIVAGHEADRVLRLERGGDDDRGNAGALRFFDRTDERVLVERREDDAVDVPRGESFDDLHLLFTIVFADRSLPDDVDAHAVPRLVARGLHRAGVNRLPELVRGA